MFKSFHGYNLLAKHQDDKKQKKAAENLLSVLSCGVFLLMPLVFLISR